MEMEHKKHGVKFNLFYQVTAVLCVVFVLILSICVFVELQSLRHKYEELQRNITATQKLLSLQSNDNQHGGSKGENGLDRQGRQLSSHNLISDLIHAQAQILQAHCSNDSKLCMQGPKGEKGDKGNKGNPGDIPHHIPQCACLVAPTLHVNVGDRNYTLPNGRQLTLDCRVSGRPAPYITWTKDGIGIQKITSSPHLIVTSSGLYACTAENILGTASAQFHVTDT